MTVPLDHSGVTPGTVSIAYSVLPATGPRTGTLVFLTGGPGQAAVRLTERLGKELEPVRRTHDVVMVDQRGTGRSDAVVCDMFASSSRCATRLGDKRTWLTTAATARDLEYVRVALGVEQIAVLGVSYGTKVAGEYVRRFPARTSAVVLDSPAPLDGWDLIGTTPVKALPRVLREICASGPCERTVRDPRAVLNAAVKRVQRGAIRVSIPQRIGKPETARVTELNVTLALLGADGDELARPELPAALASLARGDALPLLRAVPATTIGAAAQEEEEGEEEEEALSWSRFLATACVEGRLPWAPDSDPSTRRAASTRMRDRLDAALAPFSPRTVWRLNSVEQCLRWPAAPLPEPVPTVAPDVPVLLLSGRADLRTPLESAQQIAATYPQATLLDFPYVGHSVLTQDRSGCAVERVASFLAGQGAASCASRSKPVLPAAAYYPASLSALRGPLQAVEITLEQLQRERAKRAVRVADDETGLYRGSGTRYYTGLRRGYATERDGRLRLRELESIRGVRVSGKLTTAGHGRLSLSGPAGLSGTLRVRGFKLRG